MNGFAAEGFTKGLVTGLEAGNTLTNSSHERQLSDQRNEWQKHYYESAALKDEMDAQKTAGELRSKKRSEMLPQLMPIAHSVANGEPVTEEQMKLLSDSGINLGAISDDGAVDRLKNVVDLVRQKKIDMNHPMVGSVLNDFLGHKVQRGIGGVSIDPATNTPIRVDKKEIIGLSPHPTDPNLVGVNVRVTGKDENGNTHSYDDLASAHGTSHPEDNYLFFNQKQIEAPLAASVALNAGLKRNSDNRQMLGQMLTDYAIDPETQAKIGFKNAQAETEKSQQRATEALADQRSSHANFYSTEKPKTEAARRGLIEKQAGTEDARSASYDRSNRPTNNDSLGSAKTSSPKVKDFDESLAAKQANRFVPAPRDQYDNKEKPSDETIQKRNAHIGRIRDLMRVGGVENQHDAASYAEKGEQVERVTKDGRKFKGIRVLIDGKPTTFPTEWIN